MSHSSNNQQWQARREAAVVQGSAPCCRSSSTGRTTPSCGTWRATATSTLPPGIAVLNTGHNHPKVVAAVREQLEKFSHTCFQVTPYPAISSWRKKLNALVRPHPKRTLFLSTGAGRWRTPSRSPAPTPVAAAPSPSGGFHGRTMMGMALTGKVVPYKTGFLALPGGGLSPPFPPITWGE